jgi:hypothetical protein
VECKTPGFGGCARFTPGGCHQLLPDHFLWPELCFPHVCERRARLWLVAAVAGNEAGPAPNVLQHGSDTGAMMWWGVPVGFIESRSLLEQGELPLWNRYGHAGDTLIGQAVSMLGDPLHLIVILGTDRPGRGTSSFWRRNSSFASVWAAHSPTFGKPAVVADLYRARGVLRGLVLHQQSPGFFVFAYAPWILLSAIEWLDLRSGRHVRWGLVWLLVNFACFNAGHVEVAVVLIGGLNLAAVACALTGCRNGC